MTRSMLPPTTYGQRRPGRTLQGTTAQRLNAPRRPDPADDHAAPATGLLNDTREQFYHCARCGKRLDTSPYPCLECGGPAVTRSHRGRVEVR
jgi:hypothetical protein